MDVLSEMIRMGEEEMLPKIMWLESEFIKIEKLSGKSVKDFLDFDKAGKAVLKYSKSNNATIIGELTGRNTRNGRALTLYDANNNVNIAFYKDGELTLGNYLVIDSTGYLLGELYTDAQGKQLKRTTKYCNGKIEKFGY